MKKDKAVEKGKRYYDKRIRTSPSHNEDEIIVFEALQITAKAMYEKTINELTPKKMLEQDIQIKQLQKHINNNVQCKRCSIRRDNEDKIKQLQKENEELKHQ